jgi:hypothetical protein
MLNFTPLEQFEIVTLYTLSILVFLTFNIYIILIFISAVTFLIAGVLEHD